MFLPLLSTIGLSPDSPARTAGVTYFAGTVAPLSDGIYQLEDGRYARFLNSHWRAPHASMDDAAQEEKLSTFSLPCMRHRDEHRWRVPASSVRKKAI